MAQASEAATGSGSRMKMVLTPAATPDEYLAWHAAGSWQRAYAEALRAAVREAAPQLQERLKWGHIVYFQDAVAAVLLIRIEPQRLLFGFWQGQRLRHIEPRLRPGGKYQMATLELRQGTPLERAVVLRLTAEAVAMAAPQG